MSFTIKIIGAVLVVTAGTVCGFYFSLKLSKRKEFLIAFKDFLSALETNIRYKADDIITLITTSSSSPMLEFFSDNVFSSFMDYWNSFVENLPKSYGLTKEDINLIKEFGKNLGTTDIEGQLNHIELYKNHFETQYKKSEDEYKTKSKLYKVLGFFIGAVTALILI